MAEQQVIHSEAVYKANRDLCSFSMRWELDGDYMRCRACGRPQLTNYALRPFQHNDGCKAASICESNPWITFLQLLAPLNSEVAENG